MHTAGNPHIQTDPRNIAVAQPLAERMADLDAGSAATTGRGDGRASPPHPSPMPPRP